MMNERDVQMMEYHLLRCLRFYMSFQAVICALCANLTYVEAKDYHLLRAISILKHVHGILPY